ncbi:formate/nitrite transporter family protein [Parvibacter caecicola]|uniref:Formate/nitrite transporter n=1 Tax=Parvibacter caecicola TaxID=747645 RepID=A0A7W5D3X2_9ACTN|nr:formate/nitrite transporter family protein [Parvibacter caecicola]MBB3172183.1 formate/nitrite transporter [Parvibacter caecicola]MCR2041914.1 formate/nitrite transporter family protein [Parvibacter caecicola]
MSIVKEDLMSISPDALAPAAIEAKAENVGVAKATMAGGKCFVSAMLAGAFIGFGGMFFCTFLGDTTMAFGVQRLVGGLTFCLGLCLVLCCGAELFTGNVLMACAKASGRISFGQLFRNWGIVWVGNLAGSLLAVAIIYLSNLQGMNGGAVGEAFVSVAAGKVALEPVTLFFKAVLCNILVCLAVWIGFSSKTTADKVLGILLPISAFVACGFEHCVANMFFLPMGLLLNAVGGFGVAGAMTLGGVAYNLVLATLGNIAGGLLVGMAYWFIYRKKQEK